MIPDLIAVRSTFLRKYFPKSSVPHIFGRHFLAVDLWLRWFLPIFACRGGPGSAARCGGGPRGTQKLIRICFFCSPEPFTKIFWKRKPREEPRENLPKTFRKPPENLPKTSRKPCENLANTLGILWYQCSYGTLLFNVSQDSPRLFKK